MTDKVLSRKFHPQWRIEPDKRCSLCGNRLRHDPQLGVRSCSFVKCRYHHKYRGKKTW